jgi:hypothetical protein
MRTRHFDCSSSPRRTFVAAGSEGLLSRRCYVGSGGPKRPLIGAKVEIQLAARRQVATLAGSFGKACSG